MHAELAGHDCERRAPLMPCSRQGNRFVGQFSDHAPSPDTGMVEVVDDRRSVQLISAGERVDRRTLSAMVDQLFDFNSGEPSLHRV